MFCLLFSEAFLVASYKVLNLYKVKILLFKPGLFWKKIGKLGKEEPPKFLSTHPSRDDRVNDLTFYSDKVMDLYFKSKEGWVKFKNPN